MKKMFLGSPDSGSFNCIFLTVMLTLLYQTAHTLMSNVINILISLLIICLGVYGWASFSSKHKIPGLLSSFAYIIIYLLVVGFAYGWSFTHNHIGLMLSQDLRYVLLFLVGGVFALNGNMKYFHKIMKVLAVFSILFAIPALLFFDYSVAAIEGRSGTWSMSYFYWWCSACCFCYWGYYALFEKKDRWLGFGTLFVYFFIGLLFLKRSPVIDLIVILICYNLLSGLSFSRIVKLLFVVFLLIGVTMLINGGLVNNLFNLMSNRFDVAPGEFDRQVESTLYFQEASIINLLTGNGIGHYFYSYLIRNDASSINALHLGWANLIYKGGIVYVLYYIILYVKIIKNVFTQKHKSNLDKICYGVAISSLISMFYEGSWTYTLLPFCISAPIFYAALNKCSRITN